MNIKLLSPHFLWKVKFIWKGDKIMSNIKLINIGFGNIVPANRIIAIVSPESAPIKRLIQDGRDSGRLIDATYGRRTRAVIVTDSDHIILSSIQPETVANRIVAKDNETSEYEGIEIEDIEE